MRTTLAALMAVVCLLGLYSAIDLLERRTEERLTYQRWVHDSCIPAHPGERAIAVHEGQRLRCTIYTNTGYGMAPAVISAAVMEMPL